MSVPNSNADDNAYSQSPSGEQSINDEIYVYALEQLMNGRKPSEVRKSLIEAGYSPKQSDKIMRYANDFRRQNEAKIGPGGVADGNTNQLIGCAFIAIALIVSIGSFMFAGPGGAYVVTTGLFVTGIVMIFRGQAQSNQK